MLHAEGSIHCLLHDDISRIMRSNREEKVKDSVHGDVVIGNALLRARSIIQQPFLKLCVAWSTPRLRSTRTVESCNYSATAQLLIKDKRDRHGNHHHLLFSTTATQSSSIFSLQFSCHSTEPPPPSNTTTHQITNTSSLQTQTIR